MSKKLEDLYKSSHLYGSNAPYIETYYEDWLDDESSVPPHWAQVFSGMLNGGSPETGRLDIQEKFRALGRLPASHFSNPVSEAELAELTKQAFNAVNASAWGRVDFIVDRKNQPWLIEVNLSPSLGCDSILDQRIKGALSADLFTLAGIVPLEKRHASEFSHANRKSSSS